MEIKKYIKKIKPYLYTKYLIILSIIRYKYRYLYFKNKKIKNNITILSQNCIGGMVYHDFGLKFNSPTINLFFTHYDFIKFCNNLKYYLELDLVEIFDENYKFPVGLLGDIKLFFVHYNSFEEAKNKWNERKKRINFNNIYIICTDQDVRENENLYENFINLPYEHKIMFSHIKYNYKEICFIPGFKNMNEVPMMTDYYTWYEKRYYDKFDFYKWLK